MDTMQNQNMCNCNACNACKCHHHKVLGLLVILFGLTFLLGNWGILSLTTVNLVWPMLVILAGLMKLIEKMGMCKCC